VVKDFMMSTKIISDCGAQVRAPLGTLGNSSHDFDLKTQVSPQTQPASPLHPFNNNVLRLFLHVSCTKNNKINQKERHVATKGLINISGTVNKLTVFFTCKRKRLETREDARTPHLMNKITIVGIFL
jgi:hypothetical protein